MSDEFRLGSVLRTVFQRSNVRRAFRWKISSFVLPTLLAIFLFFVQIYRFPWAYVFLSALALWALPTWLLSPYLANLKGTLNRRSTRRNAKRLGQGKRTFWIHKWTGVLFMVVFYALGVEGIRRLQLNHELELLHGWLAPSNRPDPATRCKRDWPSANAPRLYLGTSVFSAEVFPHAVVQVGSERIMLDRDADNHIALSANLFSSDGKIVATLDHNEFTINANNYFRMSRPSLSDLTVFDQYNHEVLSLHYLNPFAIRMTGVFAYPRHKSVRITQQDLYIGTERIDGMCSNGATTMADVFAP